jgi:predicted DCC family thiol-disulfide oxidoreductase YuxK
MADPVVLFDGVCNLCNRAVDFILTHERDCGPKLRFAPLQSDVGRALLEGVSGAEAARASAEPDTIVLVEGGEASTYSTAALRIARHLRPPFGWAFVLLAVPRPIRDAVYRFVARRRYKWFGKTATCRVPTPELAGRFLG